MQFQIPNPIGIVFIMNCLTFHKRYLIFHSVHIYKRLERIPWLAMHENARLGNNVNGKYYTLLLNLQI